MTRNTTLSAKISRPSRFDLLLAALAVLGAALILAREATYGVGLIADWATYISTARNLLDGEWFVQIYGWPYLHWPPLYPMLLAAASLGVFDPYDVAGPLNAAVFGLTIFVAGQGLRRHVQHPFLIVGACCAIMLAIPLTRVASFAISEAPFILFVTLSLVLTSRFLDTARRSDLIWAAAFASLAFLTRYMGVALIIAVVPLLLLQRSAAPLEKAKRIGLYLLIAAAPVGLWLVQNFLLHGSIHGQRQPSPYSLLEILDKFLSDIAEWVFFFYLPSGDVRAAAAVFAAVVLLTLAAAVGYTLIRSHRKDEGMDGWSPFYLFGGFALVYLIYLTAAQSQTEILPLGGRLLSPAYVPLLFTAVFALDRLLSYARGRTLPSAVGKLPVIRTIIRGRAAATHSLLIMVIALVFSLWLAGGAAFNVREIVQANEQGLGGIIGPAWANSEVLQFVREAPADVPILSNSSVTYIYTGREDDHLTTHADDIDLGWKLNPGAKRQIENAADGTYIAWLHSFASDYGYSIEELPHLEPVAELSDGIIFKVNRAYDAADRRAE